MTMKRRTTLAAAAFALGALALAACSSTTDEAATTAASATQSVAAMEETATAPAGVGTVVDVASNTEGFSTLVTALNAAGLVDTLNGEGPFTVFAPNDAAFAALPPGLLDALLLPENEATLKKILTYHVVPGTVMAADVTDGEVATVEGQSVTFSTANGVMINNANVIQADVLADNGVIHVIDAVILPPDVDPNALLAK